MDNLEMLIRKNKTTECELCREKLVHMGGGRYKCERCDHVILDDFGKIKQFLEENGTATIAVIAQQTGVKIDVIEMYLKKGRVEISEDSNFYLKCEKCGCSIRSGRYCISCAKELSQGIQRILYNEVGEKPKRNPEMQGKMHYLNRKNGK